ncbi:MAG: hypothetical protein ACTS27_10495 [Phycisphaerales bacterium]
MRHPFALVVLAALAAPVAVAQDQSQPEPGRAAVRPPVGPATRLDQARAPADFWQFDASARGMVGADGKQSGDFDLARVDASLAFNTTLRDDLRLRVSFGTSQSYYDFSDVTTVIPGTDDPWGHMQVYRLGGGLFGRVNETWSWFAGVEGRAAFESGADFGDSLELRGTAGAQYRVSDDLMFTFGVAAGTQIEDDVLVIPLLGIEWDISERTRLASRDLGLILSHEIAQDWSLGIFGSFEFRDWRLDDSRSVNPGGVAREKRVVVGAEARYRPSNRFEFALEGGVVAWQKLKGLDDDGRKIGEQEFDPAPYLGASVIIRF